MSDTVLIAVISAVSSIAAAIVGLLNNVIARRQAEDLKVAKADIQDTKNVIVQLEKQTNSMKDALVAATGQAAYGKGLEVGKTVGIVEGKTQAEALEQARLQTPPVPPPAVTAAVAAGEGPKHLEIRIDGQKIDKPSKTEGR